MPINFALFRPLFVALLLFLLNLLHGEVLLVDPDTDLALYVNGQEYFPDASVPVLPMNGVRRINTGETNIRVYRTARDLTTGDLLALHVNTRRSSVINVTDALGRKIEYPAPVGIAVTGEYGTMSTDAFKCFTQKEADDDVKTPFQELAFNDSHWPFAYEQAADCCPWRDRLMAWNRIGAKWIGLNPAFYGGNISGPRQMFCRYRVPGDTLVSRLPVEETQSSSATAPQVEILKVSVSVSLSKIEVLVDRVANVYCGVIDGRYVLRVPTHNELKSWGIPMLDVQGSAFGYEAIGDTEFTREDIDHPAMERHTVLDLDECEQICSSIPECAALTYYFVGVDFITGTNCKLMNATFNASLRLEESQSSEFQLRQRVIVPQISILTYAGMLLPGTLYNTYCSAEDPVTGEHMNFSAVEATLVTERTQGCTDCGSTDPPAVQILGGWAKKDSVGIVAIASRSGRIFCFAREHPPGSAFAQIEAQEIQDAGFSNLATVGGQTLAVIITGLSPEIQYQITCVAEADGGLLSVQDQIDSTRRLLNTSSTEVTINSMEITRQESLANELFDAMTVRSQVTRLGYMWCQVFPQENMILYGVPEVDELEKIGLRAKVFDLQQDAQLEFDGLDKNSSFEVWCTARYDDFRNETDADLIITPYPIAIIRSAVLDYNSISLTVSLSKSPAHLFCDALPWALRPTTERPSAPNVDQLAASPYNTVLFLDGESGTITMEIAPLVSGFRYDVYCYAEFYRPPPPPGAIAPPRQGMSIFDIIETRYAIHMPGPLFDELGWECISGRACSVDHILGIGLTETDQLIVRADACPGRCRCAGVVDANRKGGFCSEISQDPLVVNGIGIEDKQDPRGAWCYVRAGTCEDEEPSVVFPNMILSYKVCTYNLPVSENQGASGFPNGGLASVRRHSSGRAFDFSLERLIVPGRSYDLCWCNGTESSCKLGADFHVRIGALHMSGPSSQQMAANMSCRVGLPCILSFFNGHAVEDGSRLVALPEDPRGCRWERASLADPPGIPDFPNLGVSETYRRSQRRYIFGSGSVPLVIPGGVYNLCWCGPPARTWSIAPGQDYRIPNGIVPPPCPDIRADAGGEFLTPAGKLLVIGPEPFGTVSCRLGSECVTPLVQGFGLQGSDRLVAASRCGEASRPPTGWSDGAASLSDPWVSAGWAVSEGFSPQELEAFGIQPSSTQLSRVHGSPGFNTSNRGAYGFPNYGMTVPHATPGYFTWGGPIWAFAGTYILCWCGAEATVDGCESPRDFLAPVGLVEVSGPGVLPFAAQMFTCVRQRQCELSNLQGTQPPTSRLMVAAGACAGPAAEGFPRQGQSLPSVEGTTYSWGSERVMAHPRRYYLCWCSVISNCEGYQSFESYAGVLQVKAPTASPTRFFCPLASVCNITGISGEGLNNRDTVMILVKCGEAVTDAENFRDGSVSLATFDDGGTFMLPAAQRAGLYQVCWCAAEQICLNGRDYGTTLGRVEIGGPEDSVTYRCFEWEPCVIEELEGRSLSNGDRLLVVPDGTDCYTAGPELRLASFPNNAASLPATEGGRRFSWGSGLVRADPGVYALCWCHAPYAFNGTCSEDGPFNIPGGVLRIGDSKEFQYVTRPEDNPPREGDQGVAYLLAIPLPLLFFAAICLGVKKLIGRKMREQDEAPNPWAVKTDDISSMQQQRSKLGGEVMEVSQTRAQIQRLSENRARQENQPGPRDALLALYNMVLNHSRLSRKKPKLKRMGPQPNLTPSKSLRSLATSTTDDSVRQGLEVRQMDDIVSSDDEIFASKKPKAPPKTAPKPPSLEFLSVHDPRVLHILDQDSKEPHTLVSYDLD